MYLRYWKDHCQWNPSVLYSDQDVIVSKSPRFYQKMRYAKTHSTTKIRLLGYHVCLHETWKIRKFSLLFYYDICNLEKKKAYPTFERSRFLCTFLTRVIVCFILCEVISKKASPNSPFWGILYNTYISSLLKGYLKPKKL